MKELDDCLMIQNKIHAIENRDLLAKNSGLHSVNKRINAKIDYLTDELESTKKENRTLKNDRLFLLIAWSILAASYFARCFS